MKQIRLCISAVLFLASSSVFSEPVKTKEKAVQLALEAIHHFDLTTLKDECGAITVFEKQTYFEIVVRERHAKRCNGTPESGPRLFNVRVRKRDGQLTSDVYDGMNYRLVDHKPGGEY